jgi:hypothetical protein
VKISQDEQALLDSCCCLCLEETVLTTGDYRWCDAHRFRGELLQWGMAHSYPMLHAGVYIIAQGAYFWVTAATIGTDDMVYVVSGIIEILEKEEALA